MVMVAPLECTMLIVNVEVAEPEDVPHCCLRFRCSGLLLPLHNVKHVDSVGSMLRCVDVPLTRRCRGCRD